MTWNTIRPPMGSLSRIPTHYLRSGEYRAEVTMGIFSGSGYTAEMFGGGVSIARNILPTEEKAKAWCEAQMKALVGV